MDSFWEACAVRLDGTIDCWDTEGSIVQGRSRPPGESEIGYRTVTIDGNVICGLRNDNQIRCWNRRGKLWTGIPNNSPLRDNAQLLGIDLGEIGLSSDFDQQTLAYTASVSHEVASLTVKPVLTNSLVFVTIYSDTGGAAGDDGVVALAEGANAINIHVLSASRTATKTYTVTVTRAAETD